MPSSFGYSHQVATPAAGLHDPPFLFHLEILARNPEDTARVHGYTDIPAMVEGAINDLVRHNYELEIPEPRRALLPYVMRGELTDKVVGTLAEYDEVAKRLEVALTRVDSLRWQRAAERARRHSDLLEKWPVLDW